MTDERLITRLMGVTMKSPVIAASGTFGFGAEYARLCDLSSVGAISGKGLTLEACPGNTGTRVWETPSGMLNSIGLENPGVSHFIRYECPAMRALGPKVIANLGGHSEAEYEQGARLLDGADIDMLELNISCPNISGGGAAFGTDARAAARVTRLARAACRKPLLVKLSPAAPDITEVARAVQEEGADGVSLTNTFPGMAVDVRQKRAVFDRVYAGLSGPAIRPLALRLVRETARAVRIPVVGMGGIMTWEDALAFIMVGAAAIQVGTATFHNPETLADIARGLSDYCAREGLTSVQDVRGII